MKVRGLLYALAKFLGDVQAVNQSAKKGTLTPILKRIGRRAYGKLSGRLMGKLFPPTR